MYGEIKRKFTENRNDYNLEIVSCGWPGKEWLGMPRPGLSYRFSEEEWAVIKSLVVRLVNAVKNYEDRPSFLTEYPTAHFLENVFFVDGWAILDDEDADHAWPFFVNRADQKCSIA